VSQNEHLDLQVRPLLEPRELCAAMVEPYPGTRPGWRRHCSNRPRGEGAFCGLHIKQEPKFVCYCGGRPQPTAHTVTAVQGGTVADLKNTGAEKLVQEILEEKDRYISSLNRAAAEAIESVRQSAEALTAMPKTTTDLLATAEICLVKELDLRQFSLEEKTISVHIDLGYGQGVFMTEGNHEHRPKVSPRRYRALFVLIPLEDK
jgi:hypothetical protein